MTLSDALLPPAVRPAVVADLARVLDQEVQSTTGISGMAIKTAYAGATKARPDAVSRAIGKALPDLAGALEPHWAGFQASGERDFGAYLSQRGDDVTDAILAVADARYAGSDGAAARTYRTLRGSAAARVRAALPRLGAALQRHAG